MSEIIIAALFFSNGAILAILFIACLAGLDDELTEGGAL